MDTTVQKPAQRAGILGQIYELPGAVKVDGQPYPAVKRLRANLHVVGSEKRLKAERYRKISHSNLQKFLGSKYDENDGILDLKFEFLPGKSLDEKLKSGGPPFGWKQLIKYSIHIAQGMMELHSSPNISHGGLKPSNIILKTNGDVAVADWYCSSLIDHDEMIDVLKVSDPLFLAPEILAGSCDVFSEESDVYAFGMCLLMLLSRRRPWANLKPKEVIARILAASRPEIPSVQNDEHGLHEDFTNLIKECLHQDPTQRPTFTMILVSLQTLQGVFMATTAVEKDIEDYKTKTASKTTIAKIQNTFTKFINSSAGKILKKNGDTMKWIEIDEPIKGDEKDLKEPKDIEMTFGQAHGIQLGPEVQYTAHHPGFGAHVLLYHLVFTLAVVLNVIFIILVGTETLPNWNPIPSNMDAGACGLINLSICIFFRTELVLQCLYWSTCKIGKHAPNVMKFWIAQFLYQVPGGLHSGCGFSGFLWIIFYTCSEWLSNARGPGWDGDVPVGVATSITGIFLFVILGLLVFFSIPAMRTPHHNLFETTHRYLGWLLMPVLWAHVFLKASYYTQYTIDAQPREEDASLGSIVISRPNFWNAIVQTILIFHPWLLVRQQKVKASVLKKGNLMMLEGFKRHTAAGHFGRISIFWPGEWHPFAVISGKEEEEGGDTHTMIIARAGDWTTQRIKEAGWKKPRDTFTVRLIKSPGFMYTTRLWKKIVCIASGAGIAPVLPCVMQETSSIYVVWVTSGAETFGPVQKILQKHCKDRVWIHDTKVKGRPDVVSLAIKACYKEMAEAVYIVANLPLTYAVVRGCRAVGISAFGAIWDS